MSCQDFLDRLVDATDGTPAADPEVEQHLASCEACRALVRDLQHVQRAAKTLDVHPLPPGARWNAVAARLARDPDFARVSGRVGSSRPRLAGAWLAAAALLLLIVGGALWYVARSPSPPPETAAHDARTDPGTPDALVESVESELELAAKHYENAIAGVERIAAATDSSLDPTVAATLRENLAVIDRAIEDSRTALRADPSSRFAQESLFDAFRRKIALLQDTISLMNEMRKGDEAGTARIVGDLNKP